MLKTFIIRILLELLKINGVKTMEPFIVGGERAETKYYSHSAFLVIASTNGAVFMCGSSIINQNVLLTAAHCFKDFVDHSMVAIKTGSANKYKGAIRYASKIAVHRKYKAETVENDIALLSIRKPLVLGNNVQRISLARYRLNINTAYVAGWGLTDENKKIDSPWLLQAKQRLWSRKECIEILRNIPVGSICGGDKNSSSYAALGDSGSALVADGYIQIGLVSFKRPKTSRAVVVYTDVAYFYKWIVRTASRLVCL